MRGWVEVEYNKDNTAKTTAIYIMDSDNEALEGVYIVFTVPILGHYECSGKAISQTFDNALDLTLTVKYKPDCKLTPAKRKEVEKLFKEYFEKDPQMANSIKREAKALTSGGMFKQIIQINYEKMLIGSTARDPEVFIRIQSDEELQAAKEKREKDRAARAEARRQFVQNNIALENAAEEKAAAEKAAAEKAAAEKAAAEKAAAEKAAAEKAAAEKAAAEKAAAEKAAAEKAAAEKAAAEKAAAEKAAAEKAAAEKAAAEKAAAEKAAAEKAAAEKAAAEKAAAEEAAAEEAAEKAAAEKAAAEEAAAEKAAAEKAAAEKVAVKQYVAPAITSGSVAAASTVGEIARKGSKLLFVDTKMPVNEVDFSQVSQWQNYQKGAKLMDTGKTFYFVSAGTLAVGGVGFVLMEVGNDAAYTAGMYTFIAGLVATPLCAITGLILRLSGKSKLETVVKDYNNGLSSTVSFGMQPNGFGIAYNF